MRTGLAALDAITDKVLAYHPARKRKRLKQVRTVIAYCKVEGKKKKP